MYWVYSAMLWRKSHVSQLLGEGQAFMMKWHFADIKIGQFVLDVVECSCWTQSLTEMRKYMFFPLTDPGSKQQERNFAVWLSASVPHFKFFFIDKELLNTEAIIIMIITIIIIMLLHKWPSSEVAVWSALIASTWLIQVIYNTDFNVNTSSP